MEDKTEWVILDTETDGLEYPIHTLEMAAQRMRGRSKVGEPFRVFLNHRIRIPAAAMAIHGYSEAFLEQHGLAPAEAHEKLRSYIGNRFVVAHYLRYDWNAVLLPEWRRLRVSQVGQPGFCTWLLSKRAIPECSSHRLDALREKFQISAEGAHSAIGDIEAVYRLLNEVVFPRLERIGVRSFSELQAFTALKPVLKCHCLLEGKDYLEVLRQMEEQQRRRAEMIRLLEECIYNPDPGLWTSRGLLTPEPDIEIQGRVFLFTGKMVWGSRPEATRLIESLGGKVSNSKTAAGKLDFLVLGEDSEKGWTALAGGGKLAHAVQRKIVDVVRPRLAEDGPGFSIVLESDFVDSLMKQVESAESNCVTSGKSTAETLRGPKA
jgi:DNA polymerase III epsilon subunit-like protein